LAATGLAFVLLFVAAACAYPGGTYFDARSVGHDFWRNTMCDVARGTALDGKPNPLGATLARAAMAILALGLGVLFTALPRLFASRPHVGHLVRVLGTATVPFAIAVVLLPTDRFGELHGVAVVLAGVLGLGATVAAIVGLLMSSEAPRLVVTTGALAFGIALVDFTLYVAELVVGGPAQVAVAVLERVATLGVLAWMAAVAWALDTPEKRRAPSTREA
jgi:hypothetical protein